MSKYRIYKEKYRNEAYDFQFSDRQDWSFFELIELYKHFEKNAKKYGLLREFRENGIL